MNLLEAAREKINHYNKKHPQSGCCCGFRPQIITIIQGPTGPAGPQGPVGPTHTLKSENNHNC